MPVTTALNRRRYLTTLATFALFLLFVLALSPLLGPTPLNLKKALFGLEPFADNVDANILFIARLPRVLLAAITGGALAVAGTVFQALLRNDLAAPITLGVASGSAFGAVLVIALGGTFSVLGFSAVTLGAFTGALLAVSLVLGLSRARHGEMPTAFMLLAGVTVNFFFAALVLLVHYLSDFVQSYRIVRWLMGGLDITDYATVLSICPPVFLGIATLIYFARDLNLISAGAGQAMSRGVNVAGVQKIALVAASLITGAVVAVSGPIGFVGLVVPHIVRLLVGADGRLLIPASMLFGASFLVLCDTVARTVIAPTEIPVGVITSMLGGPFFLWLLTRQR